MNRLEVEQLKVAVGPVDAPLHAVTASRNGSDASARRNATCIGE